MATKKTNENPALAKKNKIKVCLIHSYRSPNYIRRLTLEKGLKKCDLINLEVVTNTSKGPKRYWETIVKLAKIIKSEDPDVFLLCFRGHEIFWLVKLLTKSKPLIFDEMMSPSLSLIEEKKKGIIGLSIGRVLALIERKILVYSDAIITDTSVHASYLTEKFKIERGKITAVPVGAIETTDPMPSTAPPITSPSFEIVFYGSFLPLHGVKYVLEAVSMLDDLDMHFHFIGGNKSDWKRISQHFTEKKLTSYTITPWIKFEKLVSETIPNCQLVLGGPFGGTGQASHVITGKTSQALALGKPVLVGNIAEDIGFVDRQNSLVVEQASSEEIAESLRWAFHNREKLHAIGLAGRKLYESKLSTTKIAEILGTTINGLY